MLVPFRKRIRKSNKALATMPAFRVGKNGVERQYDRELRGAPGELQLEMNAHGRVVRELARDEAARRVKRLN